MHRSAHLPVTRTHLAVNLVSMMHLKLLGGARLAGDGDPVPVIGRRRHPLALLALLAIAPSRTLGRSTLVGLLWPDFPE